MVKKRYSPQELCGVTFMLADMLKDRQIFLGNSSDIVESNPWLEDFVRALGSQDLWLELTHAGTIAVQHHGSGLSATIKIDYPASALIQGLCGELPLAFHFVAKDGAFEFVGTNSALDQERLLT